MSLVMHCLVLFPLCVGDLSPRWLRLLSGLILLIHFLLWLPLFAGGGGFCVWSLFCYAVLCVFLVLYHLVGEAIESWLIYFDCLAGVMWLLVICGYGAVGQFAECDSGISRSYSLACFV